MASALRPGGRLLAVFYMNPDMDRHESGPPFGTGTDELDRLFCPPFKLIHEWHPAETYPGREARELCRVLEKIP